MPRTPTTKQHREREVQAKPLCGPRAQVAPLTPAGGALPFPSETRRDGGSAGVGGETEGRDTQRGAETERGRETETEVRGSKSEKPGKGE